MAGAVMLTASDGHSLDAWRAPAEAKDAPGLVVIQEIFGVNPHIRSVAGRFAAQGFEAVAPALFDRVRKGIELGYEAEDIAKGREIRGRIDSADAMKDIAAAVGLLRGEGRRVGVVGYCWGGALAWTAATAVDGVSAAVCYYGQIPTPEAALRCPVMCHFGETDSSIPLSVAEAVRKAHPDMPVHVYPAGHGFACDARASYHAPSAAQAFERTVAFLHKHLG